VSRLDRDRRGTVPRELHRKHPRDGETNGGFAYRPTGRLLPIRGMPKTRRTSLAPLGWQLWLGVLAAELDLAGAVVDARTAHAGVEAQVPEDEVPAPVSLQEVVTALASD
jgi:hypothetical protein